MRHGVGFCCRDGFFDSVAIYFVVRSGVGCGWSGAGLAGLAGGQGVEPLLGSFADSCGKCGGVEGGLAVSIRRGIRLESLADSM